MKSLLFIALLAAFGMGAMAEGTDAAAPAQKQEMPAHKTMKKHMAKKHARHHMKHKAKKKSEKKAEEAK